MTTTHAGDTPEDVQELATDYARRYLWGDEEYATAFATISQAIMADRAARKPVTAFDMSAVHPNAWWVLELAKHWGEGAYSLETRRAAKVACDLVSAISAARAPSAFVDEDASICIACGEPMKPGDAYYFDASGGEVHAACLGPERESYTNDGEPLKDGEPIPEPLVWEQMVGTPSTPPAVDAREVERLREADAIIVNVYQDMMIGSHFREALEKAHALIKATLAAEVRP